jgi:hypothetical protein
MLANLGNFHSKRLPISNWLWPHLTQIFPRGGQVYSEVITKLPKRFEGELLLEEGATTFGGWFFPV